MAGCFLATSSGVRAADVHALPPPFVHFAAPAEPPVWTGFYAGLLAGYAAWHKPVPRPDGEYFGLRVGYNQEIRPLWAGTMVIGGMIDAHVGMTKGLGTVAAVDPTTGAAIRENVSVQHQNGITADVRIGYAMRSPTMVYALGGYTMVTTKYMRKTPNPLAGKADAQGNLPPPDIYTLDTPKAFGWNAGVGVEHKFTRDISAFGELRYNQARTSGTAVFTDLRAGANYHF
jgi:opacity protein-like surface antigen